MAYVLQQQQQKYLLWLVKEALDERLRVPLEVTEELRSVAEGDVAEGRDVLDLFLYLLAHLRLVRENEYKWCAVTGAGQRIRETVPHRCS